MRAGQHRLDCNTEFFEFDFFTVQCIRQIDRSVFRIEALLLWTPQLSSIISKLRSDALKRQLEYVEEELQLTPWNLTSNLVSAIQGQCLLKLQGPGNILGRDAGFFYIKAPHRFESDPTATKIAPAKALTGTEKVSRFLNVFRILNLLLSCDSFRIVES